ncbi:hypothetical protein Tco_0672911 [Tanacetum coccineum]
MTNQEQALPQQEMAENPAPFTHAKQVGFNLEDVILNTKNEVALLYPEHSNKEVFLSNALDNSKVSFTIPTGGIYKVLGVNTFKKAIGTHYLSHSSDYVDPPSINIMRPWFSTIGYGEEVSAKGTLKKSLLSPRWKLLMAQIIQCLGDKTGDIINKLKKKNREKVVPYIRFLSLIMMQRMKDGYGDGDVTIHPTQIFSVNNWALKSNQPEGPPFTDHMMAICNAEKPVAFKAHKPSSNAERIPQDTKPEAKPGHKKHSTSKQPPVSSSKVTKGGSFKAPTGSKTGHLKRKKESNSAMDFNPSETSASTLVVAEMHKEDQQATGGPTSLGVTSEARANPQLSSDKTKFVNVGLETVLTKPKIGTTNVAKTSEEIKFRAIKLEDLAKLVPNVKVDFKNLDSPEDDSINVVDDSKGNGEEDKNEEIHSTTNDETEDISDSTPPSPRSIQLQELKNQVFLLQSQKHTLEIEKKKVEAEITRLKAQPSFPYVGRLNELPIELRGDLKEIPSKLEEFTKTITSLLLNVTKALNKFAQVLDSVSSKARDQSVSSVGQADTMPAEGEKNTNQATISQLFQRQAEKENLNNQQPKPTTQPPIPPIITTTTQMTKKLKKFDFITEDGRHIHLTEEEINHQKKLEEDAKPEAAKQKEKNCDKMLNRRAISKITKCDVLTKKGPITLKVYREDGTSEIIPNLKSSYLHLGARMNYIHMTEAELGINLDTPLSKQDPLNKLNDLVNKKRKHADDIHDYFKANKRLKSSVQYKDHFPGTVLNEPVIGPKLDDHARTFSSLLLAEVDKRNLNPLKQFESLKLLWRHLFRSLEDWEVSSLCSGTKTEEGLLKVYKARIGLLYVKRNKAISLENVTSKVGIEVQQLFSKDCT